MHFRYVIGLNLDRDCSIPGNCDSLKNHPDVIDDTIVINYDDSDSNENNNSKVNELETSSEINKPIEKFLDKLNPLFSLFTLLLNPITYRKQPTDNGLCTDQSTQTSLESSRSEGTETMLDRIAFPKPALILPESAKKIERSSQNDDSLINMVYPTESNYGTDVEVSNETEVQEKYGTNDIPTAVIEDQILDGIPRTEDEETQKQLNGLLLLPYPQKYELAETKQSEETGIEHYKKIEFQNEYPYDLWEYSIPNLTVCPKNGADLNLLVVIHTHAKHFEARKAIRETWGRTAKLDGVEYVFILGFDVGSNLGNKIKHESDKYMDIILVDLNDYEENDMAKSVMFLKWLINYCPKVKYVFKTNDDVFVNVPVLVRFYNEINDKGNKEDTMYGYLYKNYLVERDLKNKHHLTREQFEPDVFPDFLGPEGYLYPASMAPALYNAAIKGPYINLENVFITGILASKLGYTLEDIPLFSLTYPDLPKTGKCSIFSYAFVFHPVTPGGMRWFWNDLKKTGFKCGGFIDLVVKMIPSDRRLYYNAKYPEKIIYPLLAQEATNEVTLSNKGEIEGKDDNISTTTKDKDQSSVNLIEETSNQSLKVNEDTKIHQDSAVIDKKTEDQDEFDSPVKPIIKDSNQSSLDVEVKPTNQNLSKKTINKQEEIDKQDIEIPDSLEDKETSKDEEIEKEKTLSDEPKKEVEEIPTNKASFNEKILDDQKYIEKQNGRLSHTAELGTDKDKEVQDEGESSVKILDNDLNKSIPTLTDQSLNPEIEDQTIKSTPHNIVKKEGVLSESYSSEIDTQVSEVSKENLNEDVNQSVVSAASSDLPQMFYFIFFLSLFYIMRRDFI